MKRLHLIILMVLVTLTGFAQQQPQTGDVIYVYQKNGDILSFLRSEITEFYYGFEDEDGVTHDDLQMQWIVLEDSICKIPLANIDSISFVTPPTVFQPGVTVIEQSLMQYVESCDSLTIHFAANTPANLLPKVGDLLATTEMNDKFPVGFMGKVKKVTGTTVECDAVSMADIFKTYYYICETDVSSDGSAGIRNRAAENKPFEKTFNLPEWNKDYTNDIALKLTPKGELALKGTNEFKFNVKPKMTVRSSFIVNGFGTTIDLGLRGDFDLTESYGIYGGLEFKPDFLGPPEGLPICPVAPGTYLYWMPGAYFQMAVIASTKGIAKQHFVAEKTFHASLKRGVFHDASARITSASVESEGCIDGTIGFGGFLEFGVTAIMTDLDKLCLRAELGLEQNSHIVLYNKDIAEAQKVNKVYEALKASNITTSIVLNTVAIADVPLYTFTHHLPLKNSWPLLKEDLVPTFDNVEFTQCYSPRTSADVAMNIRGDLVLPEKVGYQVVDEDGKEIAKSFATDSYHNKGLHWQTRVDGLEDGGDYMVSPVVNFLGFDLLAYPTISIDKNTFPVRIVNFEQTGSHYSKQQGYEYDGRNYFYKFNATTTVELSDAAKNVKDWGYIYHDIYEEDKKISCANLGGRTYPDMRWAYYYNDTERTVNLRPYIQFEGETEIQEGKPKTYEVEYSHPGVSSCPDDDHPHMIDLGLRSGTKWSCCNLGATKPGEEGGRYRWGETYKLEGDKNSYSKKDYSFYNNETKEYIYIGSDIAGTQYDAARFNWGGGWNMPSLKQCQELIDACQYDFAESDGVYGCCITGPNGNKIFLPSINGHEEYFQKNSWNDYNGYSKRLFIDCFFISTFDNDFHALVYDYFYSKNLDNGEVLRYDNRLYIENKIYPWKPQWIRPVNAK